MASSSGSSIATVSGDSASAEGISGKDQTEEIALLKLAYSGRCRVIENSGDYKNIITIQPEDLDVTIKFQMRATYPSVIPDIAVRSASLTGVQISELRNSLTAKSKQLIGTPMIQELMQQALDMLHTFGLKPGRVGKLDSHRVITDNLKEKKKKKGKNKPKSEDEVEEEKKKPMKTADDVIKRILWDESLDKDDFLVGYIDRFRGLLEKYFSAFSWEDLASVDYDDLAVPRHRIQYFKYKSVKVWDKPHRLDNVFGSARGTKTIDIVIKEVEEMEERQRKLADNPNHAVQQNQEEDSLTDDSDDDSDDEDDIIVTIGASVNIGTKTKSSLENQNEKESKGDIDANGEDSYDPYWRDKLRPNYFLCVRITDPAILDKVGEVQDHLLDKEPLFAECCIPGGSLHVTICTLGLDTAEQLVHCMNALKKMKDELISVLPKSVLRLHGVSHFYNRVIYAKVVYRDDFLDFCNTLKLNLREGGIDIRDGYEFVPHMTIMKTTRPVSRLRGSMNIDPVMYEPFLGMHFGEQKIGSINLCSMSTERRDDGFYMTPLELQLQ